MKKIFTFISLLFLILPNDLFTSKQFTDPRDGNTYKVITSDDKEWLAGNLRYKVLIDTACQPYEGQG